MTLKQALAQTRKILVSDNIEDASLESELLLRHTLQIDRVQLYLDLGRELSLKQEQTLWRLVARRRRGEPTAYITGHREFYGLDFHVDSTVLIPRPESELLVEKTLDIAHRQPVTTIAEIGTGCGAIAISLARHLPEARIYATDISPSATCWSHYPNRLTLSSPTYRMLKPQKYPALARAALSRHWL